jgi:pentatricopeptide repeat protein
MLRQRYWISVQNISFRNYSILEKTKVRQVDMEGFLAALEAKDRVPAWLKLKDILSQDSSLLKENHLVETLRLLAVFKQRDPSIGPMVQIIDSMRKMDLTVDVHIYNLLIGALAVIGDFEQITSILREMQEYGVNPTIGTFNTILQSYFKKKRFEEGFDFLSRMRMESLVFNTHTFDIVLSACISSERIDLALQYKKEMEDSGLEVSAVTLLEWIRLANKLEKFDQAKEYFAISKAKGFCDRFICSAIMKSYSAQKNSLEMLELMKYMDEHGIEKDIWIMQTLINFHITMGELEQAFTIFKDLNERELYLDSVFLHTLLNGCFELHKPEKAIELLELMQDVYVVFDQIRSRELIPAIYNIVLETCYDQFDLSKFKRVWEALERDPNCKPNALSYKIALNMYISTRDIVCAEQIVKRMQLIHMEPTEDQYAQLVQITIESRNYTACLQFIGLLKKSKTKIDISIILEPHLVGLETQILKLKNDPSQYGLIKDVFQELFKTKVPSEQVLVVVMKAFKQAKDLVGVVKIWNRLYKQYPNPQPSSTSELLHACLELGQEKTTVAIHNLLIKGELKLNLQGYKLLLELLCKHTGCERVPELLIDIYNAGHRLDPPLWSIIKTNLEGRNDKRRFAALEKITQFVQEIFPEMMMEQEKE